MGTQFRTQGNLVLPFPAKSLPDSCLSVIQRTLRQRMEEPLGIHVFPNRLSELIRRDPGLIHYEAHAPIYGDRFNRELPVPDFQGNRPADYFRKQQREVEENAALSSDLLHYQPQSPTRSPTPPQQPLKQTPEPKAPSPPASKEESSPPATKEPRPPTPKEEGPNQPTQKAEERSPSPESDKASVKQISDEFAFLTTAQTQTSPVHSYSSLQVFSDEWLDEQVEVIEVVEEVRSRNSSSQTSPAPSPVQAEVQIVPILLGPKVHAPYVNSDLLAELKQIDVSDPRNSIHRLKLAEKEELAQREAWTEEEVGRVRREWTLDRFLAQVAEEERGSRLPEWRRAVLASKLRHAALGAEEARLRGELEDWKRSKSPNWKRGSSLTVGQTHSF